MSASATLDQTRAPFPVRLLNRGGAVLERIGVRSTSPSAPKLIEIAQRRAGLDDFGGGDFFESLARLLESCQREAQLNVIGRMALRADVIRTLCNRLFMERDRRLYPEIARQEIRQPLFVVGLPRSGTTLLHILLAADPQHRAPLTWETMYPSPPSNDGRRRRIQQSQRNLASLHWLAPTFQRVHAMGAELPQECVGLMSPSFLSDQFDVMYNAPSYRAWFLKQDLSPAYDYHRRFLQHLQQRENPRRWVLKAPVHMFALPTLLSFYPDALFVQAHRDPLKAISSVSSLVAILRGVFSDVTDPIQIGQDALQYWAQTMSAFMQERDRLPAERIFDLQYAEIRRDPINAIKKIYDHFGWPLALETESRMRVVLANQPREQNGFHHYSPARFGLDATEVAQSFEAYCERFRPETKAAATTEDVARLAPEDDLRLSV